jgi:hypothetical protein
MKCGIFAFDIFSFHNKSCQFLIKPRFERFRLSPEAVIDFQEEGCPVSILTTPWAVKAWNETPNRTTSLCIIAVKPASP